MEVEASARAAVLARLWGAFAREPLAGVSARRTVGNDLVVKSIRSASGPAAAAEPFAKVEAGLCIDVDGERVTDPARLLTLLSPATPARERLAAELDNCVANLALARSARPPSTPMRLVDLVGRADALAYLEQSIVDGHPLHPLCRTRMGMSVDDVRRYAPELRPVVELAIVEVPPDRWWTTGAGLPPRLPMHPWQADRILDAHPALHRSDRTIASRPLMSLRTVALIDTPDWHLKTSVDVQMTSAVRTVSPAAIRNGPVMSTLLRRLGAGETFEVMDEVAAGAVLVDGEPSRSLAVIRRRAPTLWPGEIAVPFGVLSARSPASGRAFLTEAIGAGDPLAYFERLIVATLPPLLRLLGRGVALEAHGQNLLVVLRDLEPVRLAYRDMGGIRISPRRLSAIDVHPPNIAGDLATDDPDRLRTKLVAALFSTVVAELVATLGREYGIEAETPWRAVARTLRSAPQTATEREDAATILDEMLPMKAMTAMRLAAHPLEDIWTRVANPMAGL